MPHRFKIWNQGNDDLIMGIRVENTKRLAAFAPHCNQPDLAGNWANLTDYLSAAAGARSTPQPYARLVDVVWLNPLGYGTPRYFPGRTLVATYTGPRRPRGGYACQCYCIVDPQGYPALAAHHRTIIQVEYIAHPFHDALVVLP